MARRSLESSRKTLDYVSDNEKVQEDFRKKLGKIDSLDEQPLTNEELEMRRSWKDTLYENGCLEYYEDITKLSNEEFNKRIDKFMKRMDEMKKANQEAKAKAEQEAKAKAEQEAKEKAEQEAKEKAEQEAKEKAEKEAKAKEEQEAKAKAEQEAKAKAEQEAKEKAEKEAKAKAEQEAKAKAEQEAKEKAEQEAKEKAEQEAKEKAEQEAKEKAEQEAKAKEEQEAKAKAEQEAKEKAEQEAKAKAEQEAKERAEQEAKAKAEQEDNLRVEPEIEVSNENQTIRREEEVYTISPEGLKKIETIKYRNEQENDNRSNDAMKIASALKRGITPDEYKKMAEVLTQKEHQELYTEKYRPREESIRDEVGNELNRAEQNNNINNTQSVDLWMNRFNNWYNVIDRMSQNVKAKFVKMKDDIVKAIKTITRDRSQSYEMEEHNDEQSER